MTQNRNSNVFTGMVQTSEHLFHVYNALHSIFCCANGVSRPTHPQPSLQTALSVEAPVDCSASWEHCRDPSCPAWRSAVRALPAEARRLSPPSSPAAACPAVDRSHPSFLRERADRRGERSVRNAPGQTSVDALSPRQ